MDFEKPNLIDGVPSRLWGADLLVLIICLLLAGDIHQLLWYNLKEVQYRDAGDYLQHATAGKAQILATWLSVQLQSAVNLQGEFKALTDERQEADVKPLAPGQEKNLEMSLERMATRYKFGFVGFYDTDGALQPASRKTSPAADPPRTKPSLYAAMAAKSLKPQLGAAFWENKKIFLEVLVPLVFGANADGGRTIKIARLAIPLDEMPGSAVQLPESRPYPSLRYQIVAPDADGYSMVASSRFGIKLASAIGYTRLTDGMPLVLLHQSNGVNGMIEGSDDQGSPSIAMLTAVADSDMKVVAQIRSAEVAGVLPQAEKSLQASFLLLGIMTIIAFWLRRSGVHIADMRGVSYLYRYTDDIIILAAVDTGRIIDGNGRALEAYGYTLTEMRAKSWSDLQVSLPLISVPDERTQHSGGDDALVEETVHRRKDGTVFPVRISMYPVVVGGRRLTLAVVRDATWRKSAEQRIFQLNQVYAALSRTNEAIVRSTNAGQLFQEICRVSVQLGGFKMAWIGEVDSETRFIKPAAQFGVTANAVPGLVASFDMEKRSDPDSYTSLLIQGRPYVCNDIDAESGDVITRKKLSTFGIGAYAAFPFTMHHEVVGVLTLYSQERNFFDKDRIKLLDEMSLDISYALERYALEEDRRALTAQLSRSEEEFRTYFDRAMIGMAATSSRMEWMEVNPALCKILGYSREELVGMTWREMTYVDDISKEMREFNRVLAGDIDGYQLTKRFIRKNRGSLVIVNVAQQCLRNKDGSVKYFVTLVEDASEHERAEQMEKAKEIAEAANEMKSAFMANMSHELRTPLNAIIGYSEMLMEDAEDTGNTQLVTDLKKVHGAGKHLLSLINDILDLSKIEAGKMELYLEDFDLLAVVQEVESTVRPLFQKNNNEFIVDCPPLDTLMHADLTKVKQVLLNLISNGCKFTEQGRVALTVRSRCAESGGRVSISVSDSGIGMTPDQLGRLFQAFTQADASTTRKYGGTGLGLAISRRFCQLMDGDITVESSLGHGSTFTVDLPLCVVEKTPEIVDGHSYPADASATERDEERQSCTVLCIDDDARARELLKRMLEGKGFLVETASSGEEGLRLARALTPKVITLDVMMPRMDGWSVLSALKSDEELRHIPVIMLTIVDNRNVGYALGASDYLTKPIDRTRLITAVEKFCQESEPVVLLVEDDLATREMTKRTLEKEGWVVLEAENGKAGLEQLQNTIPGLILLDLMMPEMDGFEFIEEIQQHHRWRSIPVVVITAKDITDDDRRRLNGYVANVLKKESNGRQEHMLDEVCRIVAAQTQNTEVGVDYDG